MKVMWAFDPFHQEKSADIGLYKLLCRLSGSADKVELVYVMPGNEGALSPSLHLSEADRFKLISESLKKARIPIRDSKIKVIQSTGLSASKTVGHMLLNAKQRKAKLVGLYMHGKRGVSRFFLGSFAETAVHRSKIDLLLVSPKSKFSSQIKNVFLASDFSSGSKKELLKAIRLCKQLKAKLTVFYAAQVIYKWSLDETSSEIKKYRTDTDKMANWVRKTCLKKKLNCNVIVDSEMKPISERALFHAKRSRTDLIIVTAKVGPFAALMGGSITRQILRNGTTPVLVMKYSSSSNE